MYQLKNILFVIKLISQLRLEGRAQVGHEKVEQVGEVIIISHGHGPSSAMVRPHDT